jgi:hypothetical protein
MMLAVAGAMASASGVDWSTMAALSIASFFSGMALVVGLILARWRIRRPFAFFRYGVRLFFILILLGVVAIEVATGVIWLVVFARSAASFSWAIMVGMLASGAVGGLVMGGILFGFTLPFLILTANNRLYRERFFAVFRLEETASPALPAIEPSSPLQSEDQTPDPETAE